MASLDGTLLAAILDQIEYDFCRYTLLGDIEITRTDGAITVAFTPFPESSVAACVETYEILRRS